MTYQSEEGVNVPYVAKHHRNHSPSVISVNILTMLAMSSENTFVNLFLMKTGLKAYMKLLTVYIKSIKLHLWMQSAMKFQLGIPG